MTRLLAVLCLLLSPLAACQFVIIVPHGSDISALELDHVNNIFMARTNRLPNGQKAIPMGLADQQTQVQFYQRISDKSLRQLSAYWTTLVFSGKGRPPTGYADTAELIANLLATPGAIAYLPEQDLSDQVKVVYRFAQ